MNTIDISNFSDCFTFEDIANNQFEIEGKILHKPYKPTYIECFTKYEKLFNEITNILDNYEVYPAIFISILKIEWFLQLDKSLGAKRYNIFVQEMNDKRIELQRYSDDIIVLDLPKEKSDTIQELKSYLLSTDIPFSYTENTINLIKDTFAIKKLNKSNYQKLNDSIDEVISLVNKNLNKNP